MYGVLRKFFPNSMTTPLRNFQNYYVDFTFGRCFSVVRRHTPSFFSFTFSSDVPLQIMCGLMGQIKGTKIKAAHKRCEY